MSIEIRNVQRLRVYQEPSANFATDHSGTEVDFTDVPFVEGSLEASLMQETLDPQHAQQSIDDYNDEILGLKSCNLSFSINLAPTGTAAGDSTDAVQGAIGILLETVMGGEALGNGSTVSDGAPAAGTFDVSDASGFGIGEFIGMENDAGNLEARPVKTISSNTLTMRMDFSEAPDDSDPIYAAATYYLTEDPAKSLQFIVEGYEQTDAWLLMGMQLDSLSIELPLGQLPRLTFNFKGATWLHGDDSAGTLTGALGSATYSNASVIHTVGSFYMQDYTTEAASSALHVSEVSLSPNISYIPYTSPSGTETIVRWRRTRSAPVVTGSFTLPYQDQTYFDLRDNKTKQQIIYQLGVVAGKTVAIDLPTVQITDVQLAGSGDGIAGQTVSFKAQRDQNSTGTGDVRESAVRFAFL